LELGPAQPDAILPNARDHGYRGVISKPG
jgi:hypothetical protein